MKIRNLTEESTMYTSNAWLLSSKESKSGCPTLIDTGCDPKIISILNEIQASTGEKPVSQVIITHDHIDHSRMLPAIKKEFSPATYAWSHNTLGVDRSLTDREVLSAGPYMLEIIHVPGHSSDSICIHCSDKGILFTGDTPVHIRGTNLTFERPFQKAFESLCKRRVISIYPGHGDPILTGGNQILESSLENLRDSQFI